MAKILIKINSIAATINKNQILVLLQNIKDKNLDIVLLDKLINQLDMKFLKL